MSPVGSKPTIPVSERLQTHVYDSVAVGISKMNVYSLIFT